MSTILIIGASRGLGLEFARQYLAAGDRVLVTVRDAAAQQKLSSLGADLVLTVDVAQPSSVSGLARCLDGEKIDIALYVAGVMERSNALSPPTQEQFDRVMHTNVLGAMQVIAQVAPLVEAAQGQFVFISSDLGRIGGADNSNCWSYRVSKAALNMAVASAQNDYPQATLVALSPGWVQTDMGGEQAPLTAAQSVSAMRTTIAGLSPAHKGQFLHHDGRICASW